MTIFLDSRGMIDLALLMAAKAPELYKSEALNDRGLADAMWFRADGRSRQVEIKRAGEANATQLEEQLSRQMPLADFTDLMIIGVMTSHEDGMMSWVQDAGYSLGKRQQVFRPSGAGWDSATAQAKAYKQNYTWYVRKLGRFMDKGVHCYFPATPEDAVTTLLALYANDQEPDGGTFERPIAEKVYLSEADEARKDFMVSLMSIPKAGVGEELADAMATFLERGKYRVCLGDLCEALRDGDEASTLGQTLLRNGKRKVGSVAVHKLKGALGL